MTNEQVNGLSDVNGARDLAFHCSICLRGEQARALMQAALDRKMRPGRLAATLLRLVLRDNLVNAILDDDDGTAAPAAQAKEHAEG